MIPFTHLDIISVIAWILVIIQITGSLYILVIEPRSVLHRKMALLGVLLAVNTIIIGIIQAESNFERTVTLVVGLAVTNPMVISVWIFVLFSILQQTWTANGPWTHPDQKSRFSTFLNSRTFWLFLTIAFFPLILTVIDLSFGTRLYFTGIQFENYTGGFVHASEYTRGLLAPWVHVLIYGLIYIAVLVSLLATVLRHKPNGYSGSSLFISFLVVVCVFVGGEHLLLPYLPVPAVFLVTGNLFIVISLLWANSVITTSKPEESDRRFQFRFFFLISMVTTLVLLAWIFFLTQSEVTQEKQSILDNFELSGDLMNAKLNAWMNNSIQSLELVVSNTHRRPMLLSDLGAQIDYLDQMIPGINMVVIIDRLGETIVRSGKLPPENYAEQEWFKLLQISSKPLIQSLSPQNSPDENIIVAVPALASDGEFAGGGFFTAKLSDVMQTIADIDLGSTGMVYILDVQNQVVFHKGSDFPETNTSGSIAEYPPINLFAQGNFGIREFIDDSGKAWQVNISPLPFRGGLFLQQSEDELYAPIINRQYVYIGLPVFAFLVNLVIVAYTARKLLKPLSTLTQAAEKIIDKSRPSAISTVSSDGFPTIAGAINHLLGVIRNLEDKREVQVYEQTQNLVEKSQKLMAASQIALKIASIHNLKQLMNEIPALILEHYENCKVDLYILDDTSEYAILQSSNTDVGLKRLSQGYKTLVGRGDQVGSVAYTGKPWFLLNMNPGSPTDENAVNLQPEPEFIIPMRVSGKVIGVLDFHPDLPKTFLSEDIEILQILADQMGIAIQNARKITLSDEAVQELQSLYAKQTFQNWRTRLRNRRLTYRYHRMSVDANQVSDSGITPSSVTQGNQLEVPLTLHGQTIGSLILRRESDQPNWTDDDLSLAIDAVGQIMPVLEHVRLLEEVEQRADIEKLVNQITVRIQGSMDQESVMRNSINELSKVIEANRIRFRFTTGLDDPSIDSLHNHSPNPGGEPHQVDTQADV